MYGRVSYHFSSVAWKCPVVCDPMDCSMPGLPDHHQLLELAQTHVYCVDDAIQPSHPLLSPSPLPSVFPSKRIFSNKSLICIRWWKYWSFSFIRTEYSSVLPMNIQDWFPLGSTGWISLQSKGLLRVFPNTTVQSISSLVFSFLYGPTLTFMHDCWKSCNFD